MNIKFFGNFGFFKTNKFVFIIFFIAFFLFLYYFFFSKPNLFSEISKLNPDENTLNAIKIAECKDLKKYNDYLLVYNCKDDIYFKLFLQDNGYYLGYCTSWETPREAVLKLKEFIGDCLDLNSEDKEITEAGMKKIGLKKYLVCGRKIVFKDECIIGI